jgi:Protein of unknown function (DUF3037)
VSEPPSPFTYAILRVVPRVERGECFNAGVVLFCRQRDFLGLKVGVDEHRLAALAPGTSADDVRGYLDALALVVAGSPDGGAIARLPPSERFGWLVAPSSTIIQPSEVHTGLSNDPEATLNQLFAELVEPVPAP